MFERWGMSAPDETRTISAYLAGPVRRRLNTAAKTPVCGPAREAHIAPQDGRFMNVATRQKTNEPNFSTAYFFLEGLNEIGIDYLFCNFGTDHAPIIEEIAHRAQPRRGAAGDRALSAREHRRPHGGRLRAG